MSEIISPHLEIFNTIFRLSSDLGYDTYESLPMGDVKYPFVYIGEQLDTDQVTKGWLIGELLQTVHIYSDHKTRGDLNRMTIVLRQALYNLTETSRTFQVKDVEDNLHDKRISIQVRHIAGQILKETSPTTNLSHAVLDITIKFS